MKKVLCVLMIMTLAMTMLFTACKPSDENSGEQCEYGDHEPQHGTAVSFFLISHDRFLTEYDNPIQRP